MVLVTNMTADVGGILHCVFPPFYNIWYSAGDITPVNMAERVRKISCPQAFFLPVIHDPSCFVKKLLASSHQSPQFTACFIASDSLEMAFEIASLFYVMCADGHGTADLLCVSVPLWRLRLRHHHLQD